jgi:hypothetical protein
MTNNNLLEKVKKVNQLLEEDEPENISYDDYSGWTGYKPQYVVDAMNKVFGLGGWGFHEMGHEVVEGAIKTKSGKNDLAVLSLEVWIGDYKRQAYGQNQVTKGERGQALKSAQTDALKKALSYFSIGKKAYYGKLTVPLNKEKSSNGYIKQKKTANGKDKCPHCGTTNEYHAPDCPNNPNKEDK